VESRAFERIVLLIIFLNVIFAGILVQETTCSMWRAQQQCLNQHYLQIIQLMFASFYILELSFRIFAKKSQFFHHAGQTSYLAILELLLTILAVVERVVWLMSELPNQSFMQFTCLYMALLRSVRLITFVQTSDSFQQLQDLLHSMIQTMKSLVWQFIFMAAILYAFGLMFTLAASHHFQSQQTLGVSMISLDIELRKNFGSVFRSAYTLYIATTGGVDWDGVADVLAHVGAAWAGAFVVYQIVFYFAVMNVVTGIFCQAVSETANQDPKRIIRRELDSMRSHATNLQNVFCKIAGSNSGSFTLTELQSALEDAEMKAFFSYLNIDTTEPWPLFKCLDVDTNQVVELSEFVTECLKLKRAASALDIKKLAQDIQGVADSLCVMQDEVRSLSSEVGNNSVGSKTLCGWCHSGNPGHRKAEQIPCSKRAPSPFNDPLFPSPSPSPSPHPSSRYHLMQL